MYYFVSFNGVSLPKFNPFTQAGTRQLIAPIARMADGRAFDRLGEMEADQGPGIIPYRASLADINSVVNEEKYYELLAQTGRVGWLTRRRDPTGTHERITSRMQPLDYVHTPDWDGKLVPGIGMNYFVEAPVWNGLRYGDYEHAYGAMKNMNPETSIHPIGSAPAFTVQFTDADSGSGTITLPNSGNGIVRGVRIRVWAEGGTTLSGGFAISYQPKDENNNFLPGEPYYAWNFSGDVGASLSQQVVIDTLAGLVTDNAINPNGKIDDFTYHPLHNNKHIIGLHPGENVINITTNGGSFPAGGVNFEFSYAEAWK